MNIPEAINQGKLALGQENRPILIAEPVLQLGVEALERVKILRGMSSNGRSILSGRPLPSESEEEK